MRVRTRKQRRLQRERRGRHGSRIVRSVRGRCNHLCDLLPAYKMGNLPSHFRTDSAFNRRRIGRWNHRSMASLPMEEAQR